MVVGVVRPDSGDVRFKDQHHESPDAQTRAAGHWLSDPGTFDFRKLTVEQNILAILETCNMKRRERAVRLKYLLDELDLTAPATKPTR